MKSSFIFFSFFFFYFYFWNIFVLIWLRARKFKTLQITSIEWYVICLHYGYFVVVSWCCWLLDICIFLHIHTIFVYLATRHGCNKRYTPCRTYTGDLFEVFLEPIRLWTNTSYYFLFFLKRLLRVLLLTFVS